MEETKLKVWSKNVLRQQVKRKKHILLAILAEIKCIYIFWPGPTDCGCEFENQKKELKYFSIVVQTV